MTSKQLALLLAALPCVLAIACDDSTDSSYPSSDYYGAYNGGADSGGSGGTTNSSGQGGSSASGGSATGGNSNGGANRGGSSNGGSNTGASAGAGGSAQTSEGQLSWYRTITGPLEQESMSTTVDLDGYVYVAGNAKGITDFGHGDVDAAGSNDIFVAKYSPVGELVWAKRFASAVSIVTSISVGYDGLIAIAGDYRGGSVVFGPHVLEPTEKDSIFVAAIDSTGQPMWAKSFGGDQYSRGAGVAVSPCGNIVFAGSIGASMIVGAIYGGEILFTNILGSVSTNLADFSPIRSVTTDVTGNIYVTGATDGPADFGDGYGAHGSQEGFVAKFGWTTGALKWVHTFGGANNSYNPDGGDTVAVVDYEDIVLTASVKANASFEGIPFDINPEYQQACVLMRLSGETGLPQWTTTIDAVGCKTNSAHQAPSGQIAWVSTAMGQASLPNGVTGDNSTYLLQVNAQDGTVTTGRVVDELSDAVSSTQAGFWGLGSSAVLSNGDVVIQTTFYYSLMFDGQPLESKGWGDVLLAAAKP